MKNINHLINDTSYVISFRIKLKIKCWYVYYYLKNKKPIIKDQIINSKMTLNIIYDINGTKYYIWYSPFLYISVKAKTLSLLWLHDGSFWHNQ